MSQNFHLQHFTVEDCDAAFARPNISYFLILIIRRSTKFYIVQNRFCGSKIVKCFEPGNSISYNSL